MIPQDDVIKPDPRLGGDGDNPYLMWQVTCPACGSDIVEQTGPGGDHGAVTVHPDRDLWDSPIGTRGGFTEVRLFCDGGHGFDLIIANHKGSQYIGIRDAGSRYFEYGPDDEPIDLDAE